MADRRKQGSRGALRGALVGFAAGAFFGAVGLTVQAWRLREVDCAQRTAAECALERTIAQDLARWQLMAAFALCLLAAAALLVLRARLRQVEPGGNP